MSVMVALLYSLPILTDILPEKHYHHYSLLVISCHILLSSNICNLELYNLVNVVLVIFTKNSHLYIWYDVIKLLVLCMK